MKKILFVLSAAIFFASCKKDSSVNSFSGETKKLMKTTYVYDSYPAENTSFTYDAKGRVSVIAEDDYTESFNYISATSILVTERNNADNSVKRTKECTLNEKGYINQIIFRDPAGVQTYSYNYTYNAEGYIIKQIGQGVGGNTEFEYTITNGDVVLAKLYYDGVLNYTGHYFVDENKLNKCQFGYGGYWSTTELFGKPSKHFLKEYKSINPSGTTTWHTKYDYEIDANGYPVKLTTDYILSGTKGIDTYTFQ